MEKERTSRQDGGGKKGRRPAIDGEEGKRETGNGSNGTKLVFPSLRLDVGKRVMINGITERFLDVMLMTAENTHT